MYTTPIYIKSLKLSGVKTFSFENDLKLSTGSGKIPNWTLILGENGIGKSTLLQCLAWMKPTLPYGDNPVQESEQATLLNDEENEVLEKLVTKSTRNIVESELTGAFVGNQRLASIPRKKQDTCITKMSIKLNPKRNLQEVLHSVKVDGDSFRKSEIIIFGYSASRVLGKQNLDNSNFFDTIPNFINVQTEIYDAEEILHTLNYEYLMPGTSAI